MNKELGNDGNLLPKIIDFPRDEMYEANWRRAYRNFDIPWSNAKDNYAVNFIASILTRKSPYVTHN